MTGETHDLLLGRIAGRLDAIDERLDKIDRRLDDGDDRFETIAISAATSGVERKIALRVGSWVIGLAVSAGGALLAGLFAHAPAIASWIGGPRH